MIKNITIGLGLALAFSATAMADNSKESAANEKNAVVTQKDSSANLSATYVPPTNSSALPAAAAKKGGHGIAPFNSPALMAGLGALIAIGIIVSDNGKDEPNSP